MAVWPAAAAMCRAVHAWAVHASCMGSGRGHTWEFRLAPAVQEHRRTTRTRATPMRGSARRRLTTAESPLPAAVMSGVTPTQGGTVGEES